MRFEEDDALAPGNFQRHRLVSLDVYRGIALAALLLASVNSDWYLAVSGGLPHSGLAQFIGFQAAPSAWAGATISDLLQPAFLFIAGVALTYSCNRRVLFGQHYRALFLHVVGRSTLLVFLGIFLESTGSAQTQWTFTHPLTQIGLGYPVVFLVWDRGWKVQGIVATAILAFTWLRFAVAPLPGADFDWSIAEGEGWKEPLTGFAAHWNKNANPAHAFDVSFLNRFPRTEPFLADPGGYATLNFIPSLVVMIFGLMAGDFVRTCGRSWEVVKLLAIAGSAGLLLGICLDAAGWCPLVKRIWTPSFVLYSTGWSLMALAGLYAVVDLLMLRRAALPFIVLGMNSLTVYLLIQLLGDWLNQTLQTHFGEDYAAFAGEALQPLWENLVVGLAVWLIAWLLYRKRLFFRI